VEWAVGRRRFRGVSRTLLAGCSEALEWAVRHVAWDASACFGGGRLCGEVCVHYLVFGLL